MTRPILTHLTRLAASALLAILPLAAPAQTAGDLDPSDIHVRLGVIDGYKSINQEFRQAYTLYNKLLEKKFFDGADTRFWRMSLRAPLEAQNTEAAKTLRIAEVPVWKAQNLPPFPLFVFFHEEATAASLGPGNLSRTVLSFPGTTVEFAQVNPTLQVFRTHANGSIYRWRAMRLLPIRIGGLADGNGFPGIVVCQPDCSENAVSDLNDLLATVATVSLVDAHAVGGASDAPSVEVQRRQDPLVSPRPQRRPGSAPMGEPRLAEGGVEPTPTPTPDPVPAVDPQPGPAPAPRPTPEPEPAPHPQPAPGPTPAPTPTPQPDPAPGRMAGIRIEILQDAETGALADRHAYVAALSAECDSRLFLAGPTEIVAGQGHLDLPATLPPGARACLFIADSVAGLTARTYCRNIRTDWNVSLLNEDVRSILGRCDLPTHEVTLVAAMRGVDEMAVPLDQIGLEELAFEHNDLYFGTRRVSDILMQVDSAEYAGLRSGDLQDAFEMKGYEITASFETATDTVHLDIRPLFSTLESFELTLVQQGSGEPYRGCRPELIVQPFATADSRAVELGILPMRGLYARPNPMDAIPVDPEKPAAVTVDLGENPACRVGGERRIALTEEEIRTGRATREVAAFKRSLVVMLSTHQGRLDALGVSATAAGRFVPEFMTQLAAVLSQQGAVGDPPYERFLVVGYMGGGTGQSKVLIELSGQDLIRAGLQQPGFASEIATQFDDLAYAQGNASRWNKFNQTFGDDLAILLGLDPDAGRVRADVVFLSVGEQVDAQLSKGICDLVVNERNMPDGAAFGEGSRVIVLGFEDFETADPDWGFGPEDPAAACKVRPAQEQAGIGAIVINASGLSSNAVRAEALTAAMFEITNHLKGGDGQ